MALLNRKKNAKAGQMRIANGYAKLSRSYTLPAASKPAVVATQYSCATNRKGMYRTGMAIKPQAATSRRAPLVRISRITCTGQRREPPPVTWNLCLGELAGSRSLHYAG